MSKNYYVYRFLNEKGKILYIGKTVNMKNRMSAHFNGNGHLPDECYESVNKVEFIALSSKFDMDLYERQLINSYAPTYNTEYNKQEETVLELPFENWSLYENNPVFTKKEFEEPVKIPKELNYSDGGYLVNFARNRYNGNTTTLSVRVPEYLYDNFKNHCDGYGLNLSEAINILIQKELGEID